jgi:single-stranded-DNA-specific exonuclease
LSDQLPVVSYSFPDCVAVIHPFRLTQPQALAGCGVSYMVAYAVWLAQFSADKLNLTELDTLARRKEFAQGRIELAAIGTIADMMPLTGVNRAFAALGLEALGKTRRVGLRALYGTANIDAVVSMYDVGFLIGPRLNAPGRLGHALDSLRLVCTKDQARAHELAGKLNAINTERQSLLEKVAVEAIRAAEAEPRDAFVLSNSDWPAGVCGLAAGKVVERFYRPAVVMEEQGELCRGSARSIKGFDITAALTSISDLLEGYGGHAMAAGFTAKKANIAEIEQRLGELVRQQLTEEQLKPKLSIDAEVELAEMNEDLYDFLRQFEPCGMGNPGAVFMVRKVEVQSMKVMGKEGKHLRLRFRAQGMEPRELEAVAFGFGDRAGELADARVDVVFSLDKNEWNGKSTLQLKVKDIRIHSM